MENLFEESRFKLERMVREHRTREKERAREVGDELKQLCGGGGGVIQEVESKKRGFVTEFEEMRKTAKVSCDNWEGVCVCMYVCMYICMYVHIRAVFKGRGGIFPPLCHSRPPSKYRV